MNDLDILIGIFWARLDSPTGKYASGTVEEISKHCAKNKLASIYIPEKPYPTNINLQQLQLLKNQTQVWLKEGLLDFYDNNSTFKQKIKDHLSLQIQSNEYIESILNNNSPTSETQTTTTLQLTEEIVQILLNTGNSHGEIHLLQNMDGAVLITGNVKMNSDHQREVAKWAKNLNKLSKFNLVKTIGENSDSFCLTDDGWKAFDQLKAQLKENQ